MQAVDLVRLHVLSAILIDALTVAVIASGLWWMFEGHPREC